MDEKEIALLLQIDALLREAFVAQHLNAIADSVEQKFQQSSDPLSWKDVPLEIYQGRLPEGIQSSWVFLLRSDSASGAERHPNSHQRVTAWRGAGDLQIWVNEQWQSNVLIPEFRLPVEKRWASIPVNTWHQAVVGPGKHWIVVSFHTAPTGELIEERPNRKEANRFEQRTYKSS